MKMKNCTHANAAPLERKGHLMKNGIFALALAASAAATAVAGEVARNPPPECKAPDGKCACAAGEGVENTCTKLEVDMGATTPQTGGQACALKVFADDQSLRIFTSEALSAVLGCTFRRVGNEVLSDGATPKEVVFSRPNGEPLRFVFADGGSVGRPDPGFGARLDTRLRMVDAQGRPCTREPAFYDLCEADGSVRRFLAADGTCERGRLVSAADARGFVTTPADMGVDVVHGPDGVRQFLTPSRLADVAVGASGYAVTVYPVREPPAKDPATGLYPLPDCPPVERVSVEAGADGRRAVVTVVKGGGGPRRYVFDYVRDDWSLTRPSGAEERRDRSVRDSECARVARETYSRGRRLLSRDEYNYVWRDWGFAATNHVEGFGGETRTTSWDYHLSGAGKGQVKTELLHTGLRTEYAYDADDRMVSRRRYGPGMMTEATTYSYAPVDPSDAARPVDARPRTVVKTQGGVEVGRTYYVYSPLTNVVERAGAQGAPYGATGALRTVTAFYPAVAGDVRSGRVRSVRHEDGRLDLHDYALADGVWTETVTHLHEQSPEPVPGRTTRGVTATNRRGEILERKTEAFIGGIWYSVARDLMTYDTTGKRIRTENLAGQATTTAWDCCHKVSETRPDGSVTTWDYDDEDRLVASSRLIPLDLTNVTWVATCYAYDDLGRQTATWTTNCTAQVGTPATTTAYDRLGRVASRTVTGRGTSLFGYSADGLVVTNTAPNGATTVTRRNADGDTLSVTGTGVTPEFHSYGILPDGTRWTKTVEGETADSPRFTKRYENLLGQIVREERSGFRGALLATVHAYDSYGRLASTASDGEPTTEYTYDNQGTRVATTRTVGSRVPRDRPVEWRKSEATSNFALVDADVWSVQTNIATCSDAAIAPLVQSRATQLTGLTAANPDRTRTTDVRGNVTEDWSEFSDGITTAKRRVPEATNVARARSRYGIALEEVSLSAVTNATVYDALGRVCATIDGRGNATRTEYDANGRRAATVDPAGARTTYAYNDFGELVAVTNALGHATVYAYDLRGRKTYEGGATYPVRYAYDLFGNKTSMTTYRDESSAQAADGRARTPAAPQGDTTTWLYDEASGMMTNKVYADGKGPAYDYDANGRLAKRTWARGIDTFYAYDGWGSLTNTTYSDTTPTITLAYDAMGRQVEARDAAGTTTFAYDAFGSLTNETVRNDGALAVVESVIERFTDAFGRDAGYALNGVRQSTLGYDPATGRLRSMAVPADQSNNPNNRPVEQFTWNYLPGSDLKQSLTYPNGLTASWTYGNRGELLEVNNALPGGTVSKYAYSYDAAGRRIICAHSGSAFDTPDTYDYRYNARSELTNATASVDAAYRYAYQFDDIGNRELSSERGTNSVYEANNLNQYTSVNDFVLQFDDDGNQTLVKTSTGIWQVTYNGENRPVRWERIDQSEQSTNLSSVALAKEDRTILVMSYDRMGRRVTKNDQHFVYNGYLQIADNTGNAYVWDPTEPIATRPLVWRHGGETFFYVHDGNKNVSEVISVNGFLAAHYEYAPFGEITARRGTSAASNHWCFSSEYNDVKLGLVYYNYRHDLASLGRWISRDGMDDASLLYGFVGNAPTAWIDYIGLWRYMNEREKKMIGGILCNEKCEMTIYLSEATKAEWPSDCAYEHEQQHINDLPKDAGCKKDANGCCNEANMSPDANDYGGKEQLKDSECKAYLVTAKCCTRKAGLLGGDVKSIPKADMMRFRQCVLRAKYIATKPLTEIADKYGSPCGNTDEYDKLLNLFDMYFQRHVQIGGGWAYGEK